MSFIFQMDNADNQPTASTSTDRRRLLVEYAPKPVALPVEQPTQHQPSSKGIKSWLASHGSSYLPHDQPSQPRQRGPSPRRARPRAFSFKSDSDSSDSDSDSDKELEDDEAIFLQPRRHLSRQSSALPASSPTRPSPSPTRKSTPLHLTAQRPALPVVDLSAASGHLELQAEQQQQHDKSHWSDDESDLLSEDDEEEEEEEESEDDDDDVDGLWALHPDELDVPALVDDDESGPASTSTRSIPIPSARAPVVVGQGLMSRRLVSPPARRKTSMDGQSFWTPWMDRYLADAARA